MNLVIPKAAAKLDLLLNKLVSHSILKAGLLNKSSCLAAALGVTKFIANIKN